MSAFHSLRTSSGSPIVLSMAALMIALVVLASAQAHSSVNRCFHENTKVRLTGMVIYRKFHGPPNYGEDPADEGPAASARSSNHAL